MRILVTGATGYVGGRLIPLLIERGHEVRVLVRDAGRVEGRPWARDVEVFTGDLLHSESLSGLCENIDAAYYMVHSMHGGSNFARRDQEAVYNFIHHAKQVGKVIYLGGIVPKGRRFSDHLRSRAAVGKALRKHLPTTEFRAGPIIGSGSASFEMVRYLTERLPVMVTPRWVKNKVTPIGIRDVLSYLIAALDREPVGAIDIGGETLSFRRMMEIFADVRGLHRVIIPTPVLAPNLAALWVGLVTPISNSIAVPLIEGVAQPIIADTHRTRSLFPEINPMNYRLAVELALRKVSNAKVETRWSGALGKSRTSRLEDSEGIIQEERTIFINAPREAVYKSFSTIGGERGWLVWEWAWAMRGTFDRLIGGPGLRRGRRDPEELYPGEALDFWRVEEADPPRMLRLRAEMKVPGRAWLQWEAYEENGGTRLVQRALFAPHGLFGTMYWYSLYPVHGYIFSDLILAIANDARAIAGGESPMQSCPLSLAKNGEPATPR